MSDTIAHICSAYAFTDADKARLTDILAQAYLSAKIAAYQKAANTTKGTVALKKSWEPSAKDTASAHTWASKQVDGIADTWLDLLRSHLEQTQAPAQESLWGTITQAVASVSDWVNSLLDWKVDQIVNVTLGTGSYDGTDAWIEDVIDESESGDLIADLAANIDRIRVRVVPESSSSDVCAQYAGNDYGLDEYDSLPTFPIHPHCPHNTEIYIA